MSGQEIHSLVVRKSILASAAQDQIRYIQNELLKPHLEKVKIYHQSQKSMMKMTKREIKGQKKQIAQYSEKEKGQIVYGFEASKNIILLLQKVEMNLVEIKQYLHQCSSSDFYKTVGKIAEYLDLVQSYLQDYQKIDYLKYRDTPQRLLQKNVVEETWLDKLSKIGVSLIKLIGKARYSIIETVSVSAQQKQLEFQRERKKRKLGVL